MTGPEPAEPVFPAGLKLPVQNARSGRVYTLVRADELAAAPGHLQDITAASNEPAIYRWLWQDRLAGAPYTPEKAGAFLDWAREGWTYGSHFVFLLASPEGEVAGALDIKSADLDGAEVGYWLSARHGGVMTNAVRALAGLARAAGYRCLFARVRAGNQASRAVLLRAAFRPDGGEDLLGHPHERFRLELEAPEGP